METAGEVHMRVGQRLGCDDQIGGPPEAERGKEGLPRRASGGSVALLTP